MTINNLSSVHKLLLGAIVALVSTPAYAQITPDNTLREEASKLNQNVPINGANADLINGGALRGNNLFHSFSEFNIGDGERVYFANPSGVVNILTRVTGSNASNILGTLGVDGAANLFLINPNGILFGKNASLDVRGSFVGTTANGVQFGNQGNFSATNPEAPGLLTINPSALFFNQINASAAIVNNSVAPSGKDPAGFNAFGLRVPDGKSLLLVGGNVSMNRGRLNAFGGRVELAGASEPGDINLLFNENNFRLELKENVTRSSVSLTNQARVSVQGAGGGDITLYARNLEVLGGSILSAGIGNGLGAPETVAGDITLNATSEIKVAGSGTGIRNLMRLGSIGNGGNIIINADSFKLRDSAQLSASNYGIGNAGNVTVTAKNDVSLQSQSTGIFSILGIEGVGKGGNIDINADSIELIDRAILNSSTAGQGNAGNVKLSANNAVTLAGNASIQSAVESGAVGKGGNIDILAATLSLANGSQLLSLTRGATDTNEAGKGSAGNVNVKVTGAVNIFGEQNGLTSGIASAIDQGAVGDGGNIVIDSGSLSLQDSTGISTATYGLGSAGNITVRSKGSVYLANTALILSTVNTTGVGKAGNIDISAANLTLLNGAQLQAAIRGISDTEPGGKGSAGNINVNVTGVVNVAGTKDGFSSGIVSLVQVGTEGDGGNININAGSLKLRDGGLLDARTENNNRGGNIAVNTNVFEALNGGQLISITSGNGRAGKIIVNATDKVIISSNDPNYNDRLTNFPNRIANLGANAGLFVNSTGSGTTGDIEINSPNITLDNQGRLQANSASGNGGNIKLNSDLLLLRRGAQISTNAGTEQLGGDGGNINIDSRFIVAVPNENSDITANAFRGRGGNVNIRAQGIFGIEPRAIESPRTSDITASSERGVQGQISITQPEVQPTQGIIELPEEVIDATRRVAQICPREPGAKPLGEFTITGRGSLPPSPLEPLPGTTNTTKLATLDNNNTNVSNIAPNKAQNAIVEAQGWVKNRDGSLELVAMAPQTTPNARATLTTCPNS